MSKFVQQVRNTIHQGSHLGHGTFATVYKGIEKATSREVALKVVRPAEDIDCGGSASDVTYQDILNTLKEETRLIQSLGYHPNIVQLLGTAEEGQVIVMERLAADLHQLIKHQPNMCLLSAARWLEDVLVAVEHIHSMGVIHQDIKSSNILISSDRVAKLCDFGLARQGVEGTAVDRELVTLWYRAPELIMGARSYGPKVDEWGVGCVALEMLTGETAFRGRTGYGCGCHYITHRNYNSDQLSKIFAVLGTAKDVSLMDQMDCAYHFAKWPFIPRRLETMIINACTPERFRPRPDPLLPAAPTSAADLAAAAAAAAPQWTTVVAGLLSYDPARRISARVALRQELFSPPPAAPTQLASPPPAGPADRPSPPQLILGERCMQPPPAPPAPATAHRSANNIYAPSAAGGRRAGSFHEVPAAARAASVSPDAAPAAPAMPAAGHLRRASLPDAPTSRTSTLTSPPPSAGGPPQAPSTEGQHRYAGGGGGEAGRRRMSDAAKVSRTLAPAMAAAAHGENGPRRVAAAAAGGVSFKCDRSASPAAMAHPAGPAECGAGGGAAHRRGRLHSATVGGKQFPVLPQTAAGGAYGGGEQRTLQGPAAAAAMGPYGWALPVVHCRTGDLTISSSAPSGLTCCAGGADEQG